MSSSTCITSNYNFRSELDRRFPRPVDSGGGSHRSEVMVVDSKSCRQLYLRTAYTFTRREEKEKDAGIEKAKKCLGKVKDRVTLVYNKKEPYYGNKSLKFMKSYKNENNKSIVVFRKVKEFSYASLMSMVRRMLACTAKVDVAHDH